MGGSDGPGGDSGGPGAGSGGPGGGSGGPGRFETLISYKRFLIKGHRVQRELLQNVLENELLNRVFQKELLERALGSRVDGLAR